MIDPMSMLAQSSALLSASERPESALRGGDSVGRQFESLLIKQLLNELPIAGLEGSQAGTFLSLFHEALAGQLVAGGGLGLAEQIDGAMSRGGAALDAARAPKRPAHTAQHDVRVSSLFGERADPIDGSHRMHRGIDVAAPKGSLVHAAQGGRVSFAGESKGYGNLVVIDHGDGLETRYAHCDSIDVETGDTVANGQQIARVGDTGRATGPHLHFEVRENGIAVDPHQRFDFPQQLVESIRGVVRDGDKSQSEGTP